VKALGVKAPGRKEEDRKRLEAHLPDGRGQPTNPPPPADLAGEAEKAYWRHEAIKADPHDLTVVPEAGHLGKVRLTAGHRFAYCRGRKLLTTGGFLRL
jgi:hypothetical protein